MNVFQWVTLTVLGLLLLVELLPRRRRLSVSFWLFRCLVWIGLALAIANPNLIQRVASAIGIGRGADVVLYVFVLAFVGTSLYFYSRTVLLRRQITLLTRHVAIQEARRGGAAEDSDLLV
jgi:small membrane protein